MITQSTIGEYTTSSDDLPARVNGWRLANDREGFRYLPDSRLDSRVYYVGVVPESGDVLLIAHTGTESVSIVPSGWCAGGDHFYREREVGAIDHAIEVMRERSPEEVVDDA